MVYTLCFLTMMIICRNIFRNNGAGVSVMFTHGVKMLNNRFEDNWGDGSFGLLLKEISDSYISGNKFSNNTAGIYMEGASRIQIEGNLFQRNGWAMKIQASCMDVHVTRNNFLSNTFDIATNGVLVLNSFNHNYWDKYEGYDLNKDHVGDIAFPSGKPFFHDRGKKSICHDAVQKFYDYPAG